MWTEAELDECQSAAEQYAEVLFKAMRKAGVLAGATPGELRGEITVMDRHSSKDCGYAYAPAVVCELGDLDLTGDGFVWRGTYHAVTTPQGFSFEPYTSYAVNVFPDKPRTARRLEDRRIEVEFEDGTKVVHRADEPLER